MDDTDLPKFPFKLTEAEEFIWKQSCLGKVADLNDKYGSSPAPDKKDDWNDNRIVTPEFLETILLDKKFSEHIHRKGVLIIGAWFQEKVDLSDGHITFPLWLNASRCENGISFHTFKSDGIISLEKSRVIGIFDGHKMSVGSDLYMRNGAHFDEINLASAHICDQLDMTGSKVEGKLMMASLQVDGPLFMLSDKDNRAEFREVILNSAHIGGQLAMDGAKVEGMLFMDSLQVDGSLFMRSYEENRAEFREVILRGAHIGDQLAMTGAKVEETLDMQGLQVDGPLFMSSDKENRAEFNEVILRGAHIGDQLAMTGAKVEGTFNMNGLHVDGPLFMRSDDNNRAEFKEINLRGAHIGDQLAMTGAKVEGTLNMDSLHVDGPLLMFSDDNNRAEFKEVILNGAHIGGQLAMVGAKVDGTLNMDKLTVKSSLFMSSDKNNRAEFKEVDLTGAHIGGQLALAGARVDGMLNMDSLHVDGPLFMRGKKGIYPFDVAGDIRLHHTVIGGGLDFFAISVGNDIKEIDFSGTKIKGELRLWTLGSKNDWGNARFILKNVTCGALQDHEDAWPKHKGSLDLNGFEYGKSGGLEGGKEGSIAGREKDWLKCWLKKSECLRDLGAPIAAWGIIEDKREKNECAENPAEVAWYKRPFTSGCDKKCAAHNDNFSPQPYRQLVKVLEKAGYDRTARKISYAMAVELHNREESWLHSKWLWLEWLFVGYGYYNFVVLGWMTLFIGVGFFTLHFTGEANRLGILGLGYSIDMLLPIVKLRPKYYGVEFDLTHDWARRYFYFHQLMGWVLALFLGAGLSGLTKK